MSFPPDQTAELKLLCDSVSLCQDQGIAYLLLCGLALPEGCEPGKLDALLCPTDREGYPSRLFFSAQVKSPFTRNWNFLGGRICERNWYAHSWMLKGKMRLAQMVGAHLDGFRRAQ